MRNWSVQTSWAARCSLRADRRFASADAIFIHTQAAALFAHGVMRKVPSVVSLDATPLMFDTLADTYNHSLQAAPLEWMKFRINQRALAAAQAIVTWSRWAARSVIEDYRISADRVHVVPPGVQIDSFQPRLIDDHTGPIRILFVGGDFVRKGGPELVEAVASLHGIAELDVVTSTPGIAVPRGAPIRVRNNVAPNSPELKELLARADVFALPTRGDCHSLAIVEAMACGLPILTTRVGSMSEIVRDGENGLFVPPRSPQELAAALQTFASNPDLRRRMGRTSRAMAVAEHDATANWMRVFDVLRGISGGRERCPTPLRDASRPEP